MSEVKEYLDKVRKDLAAYVELKKATHGTPQGWWRDGYTLRSREKYGGEDTDLTYWGTQGMQGPKDVADLDLAVMGHNLKIEEYLTTLLKMVEGVPEDKAKKCLPPAAKRVEEAVGAVGAK